MQSENLLLENGHVCVVRHAYFDYLQVEIPYSEVNDFYWDFCGADNRSHKRPRIYCNISYELACETGLIRHPRRNSSLYDVKVCLVQKHTDKQILKLIKQEVGERPKPLKV